MFKTIVACVSAFIFMLFSTVAAANPLYAEYPEDSAVIKLLKEKDLTISELTDKNLDLVVENFHLKMIREELQDKVISLKAANEKLRKHTTYTLAAYRKSVESAAKGMVARSEKAALSLKKDTLSAAKASVKQLNVFIESLE